MTPRKSGGNVAKPAAEALPGYIQDLWAAMKPLSWSHKNWLTKNLLTAIGRWSKAAAATAPAGDPHWREIVHVEWAERVATLCLLCDLKENSALCRIIEQMLLGKITEAELLALVTAAEKRPGALAGGTDGGSSNGQ